MLHIIEISIDGNPKLSTRRRIRRTVRRILGKSFRFHIRVNWCVFIITMCVKIFEMEKMPFKAASTT